MTLPPPIDLLPDDAPPPAYTPPPTGRRPRLFAAVWLACAVPGLAYVWLRPPLYESAASLLTAAPPTDGQATKASVQHSAIQRQLLLGVPLLEETLRHLEADAGPATATALGLDGLREILTTEPVPDTNLVELRARGPRPEVLAPVVNAWIDAYRALRERDARDHQDSTALALGEEFERLGRQIEVKRQALERFDHAHDILSRKNGDNQAMAELTGLNASLNKASELEVQAKAKLDAIRVAIAKGEPVVTEKEEASLGYLRQRLQTLREQAKDMQRRYTPQYLALQPQLKLIPEQLAQAETAIRALLDQGQRAALSEAEQAYASAAQSVRETRQRAEGHKREVAEFSARFAEHQAMAADIDQLEKLYRKTEGQLAQVQARPVDKYPPLQVLERAYPPSAPSWPHYWRDSGIVLGGSLGVALLFLLIYDYLTRREPAPAALKLPDVRVYSVSENLLLQRSQAPGAAALAPNPTAAALESPQPRELDEPDLRLLLAAADLAGKQLLGALLSGLSLDEAAGLRAGDIDLAGRRLRVGGERPRVLPLAPRLRHWLRQTDPSPAWSAAPDRDELAAQLACIATDAGLPDPLGVDAGALRHSYILYLVRQGIRLADLESVVGPLGAKQRATYARHSPPGPGLRADGVPLVHPALAGEEMAG